MEIVIIFSRIDFVRRYMQELYKKNQDKVAKYYRAQNKMILINGDTIKGYSENGRLDGLRADAVIGVDDNYITCRSKLDKPIWAQGDLNKYIGEVSI